MGNLSITAVDIVVAVVLLGSAGFAFLRGFVHEVLAITAWVGAALAALYGFPYAQPLARQYIGSALAADIAAGAALFLMTLVVLSMITKATADRVRRSALNSVDSSLGFAFGLVRGGVLLCLAHLLITMVMETPPSWLSEAKSYPWLERGAGMLRGFAPDTFGATQGQARQVSREAQDVLDAQQTLRKYMAPQPTAPAAAKEAETGAKPAQGYDKESRSQLDRLIQANQ